MILTEQTMERLSLDTSATISEGDLRVYEVSPLERDPGRSLKAARQQLVA